MKRLINKTSLTPSVEQLLSRQIDSWTSKTIQKDFSTNMVHKVGDAIYGGIAKLFYNLSPHCQWAVDETRQDELFTVGSKEKQYLSKSSREAFSFRLIFYFHHHPYISSWSLPKQGKPSKQECGDGLSKPGVLGHLLNWLSCSSGELQCYMHCSLMLQ